jgi:hypothetical protein
MAWCKRFFVVHSDGQELRRLIRFTLVKVNSLIIEVEEVSYHGAKEEPDAMAGQK